MDIHSRKTLTIDPASWQGRWYGYWRQHAHFKTASFATEHGRRYYGGYRENLCHYVRVLLIWAPLAWFVHARFLRVLTPFRLIGGLAVASSMTLGFVLSPVLTLQFLAIMGITLAIYGALFFLFFVGDSNNWFSRIGAKIGRLTRPTRRRLATGAKWLVGTRTRRITTFAGPPVLLVIAGLVFTPGVTLSLLAILGIVAVGSALLTLGMVGLEALEARRRVRRSLRAAQPAPARGATALEVGVAFARAKKARVCPFIEFGPPASTDQAA